MENEDLSFSLCARRTCFSPIGPYIITKPERICVSTQLNSTEQRVLSYIVISRWPGRPSRPSTPSCAAAKLPFDTMGCTPLSFIISVLALCCAGVIMGFSAYVINETTFLFTSSWTVGS